MNRLKAISQGGINCAIQQEIMDTLARDESDVVRHEAAFVLGELGMYGNLASSANALNALIESAGADKSILVRHEVALALAHWKYPESIACLETLARDPAAEVRSSADYALMELARS